jgi:hypothetical protein
VKREDVGVLEVRRRPDLGQEALGSHDGGQLGPQHLERDFAAVAEVVGQIDGGHSTLADLALDAITALERRVQASDGIEHASPAGW